MSTGIPIETRMTALWERRDRLPKEQRIVLDKLVLTLLVRGDIQRPFLMPANAKSHSRRRAALKPILEETSHSKKTRSEILKKTVDPRSDVYLTPWRACRGCVEFSTGQGRRGSPAGGNAARQPRMRGTGSG